jgi:hypothetical protein
MSDKNYPKLALQFASIAIQLIGKFLYILFVEGFFFVFMLALMGGFGTFIYHISQQPAETFEIEEEVVVDSVRADMSAVDNEPVAVVVTETGLNMELRDRGPIAAGDTIGIYEGGNEICQTAVEKKTYEDYDDVPPCFDILQAYQR